eukprot:COSAG04_NODE_1649_length_6058_cov_3.745655_3_plen_442_part_00
MKQLLVLAMAAVSRSTGLGAGGAPFVERWHAEPATPNGSIFATFLRRTNLAASSDINSSMAAALAPRLCHGDTCILPALGSASSGTSVAMVVPAEWPLAEYRFQLCPECAWVTVNAADPLFAVAEVAWAPAHGTLRIVGRALGFEGALGECTRANSSLAARQRTSTRARLRPASGPTSAATAVELAALTATCYDASFGLPRPGVLKAGSHFVEIRNGLQANWSVLPQPIAYRPPLRPRPGQHRRHSPIDLATLRTALAAGGVVDLLPSTVIKLGPTDTLDIGLAGNTVVNCSTCTGATKPTLRWDAIDTHLSRPLVTLHNSSALVSCVILRVDCANPTPVVSIADGSIGALLDSVEINSQLSPAFKRSSTTFVHHALYVGSAVGFVVRNCVLEQDSARRPGPGLPGLSMHPYPVPCTSNNYPGNPTPIGPHHSNWGISSVK